MCDCVARLKATHIDYWYQTLLDFGFSGELKRLRGICRFILKNEFQKRSHLKSAVHPSRWLCAGQFTEQELDLVWTVCRAPWECRGCVLLRRARLLHVTPGDCRKCSVAGARKRKSDDHAVVAALAKSARLQAPLLETGPRAVLRELQSIHKCHEDWRVWAENAKLTAILGSCSSSWRSVLSGIRCYVAFRGELRCVTHVCLVRPRVCADAVEKHVEVYFPPTVEILLTWSTTFRCCGTWQNYCSYVKTGCLIVDAPVHVSPSVARG